MPSPIDEDEASLIIVHPHTNVSLNHLIEQIGMGTWHWQTVGLLMYCWAYAAGTQVAVGWMLLDLKTLGFTSLEMGVIAAAQIAGQVVGFVLFGFLGDKYGRRLTSIGSVAGLTVCTGLMALCTSAWQIVLVGGLKAMFYGAVTLLTKNLCAEILPVQRRGMILNGMHCFWQVGGVYATATSYLTSDYRTLALLAALPGVPLLMVSVRIPESPRWLLENKSPAECRLQVGNDRHCQQLWLRYAE